ncbi:FAD-dependent thymidylate synthase [Benzoatithermus flavus]|uniref:Flavin-dependent thymidylate synthase n=1 Tax=Benzoatithermus flavus TaxID=3108223 RepID=A0ABU8XXR1_9PROT
MALDEDKRAEIESLRASQAQTRRATVPALEAILYEPLPVLDHGFVRVIDYMGDDAAIVQAARVSYGKGTKQVSNDRGLINYLMRHRHTSPFEMCEIKLHVKLPIFVARQWIRHRTANVNEYSARYSVLDREFYLPDQEFLRLQKVEKRAVATQASLFELGDAAAPQVTAAQSTTNKQGREGVLEANAAASVLKEIGAISSRSFTVYEKLLGDEERPGIARELARMVLPLNTYTQWYWKIDLHNLLHFLRLRYDDHAQHEIRAYAEVLFGIVQKWVPLTARAFEDYRLSGAELSAKALEVIRRRLRGEPVTRENSGLSAGEWRELESLLPELAGD